MPFPRHISMVATSLQYISKRDHFVVQDALIVLIGHLFRRQRLRNIRHAVSVAVHAGE